MSFASWARSRESLGRHTELPFDAVEALACGLITDLRDFTVPQGHQISNI